MKGYQFMDNLNKHLVFVYGTLKRDYRNSHYLKDAIFVGDAETCEKYLMRRHSYDYPAVIEYISNCTIHGELYLINDFKSLDRLEGTPDLFYRKEISIVRDAQVLNAWMYFYTDRKDSRDELREQIKEWKE